jgi:hypothetical protein
MAAARTKVEWLLDDLCGNLGFSLPVQERERLERIGLSNVEAFTEAVFEIEGLDPQNDKALRQQVRSLVAKYAHA